jgi:hypothetical protein
MTIARLAEDPNLPALSGKTVKIKDSMFAEDVVEIPVELNDAILNRYSYVEEMNSARAKVTAETEKVTGLMHRFQSSLPKDPTTGETVIVVSGIEARLNIEQKEKLTTTKVKED